MKASVLPLHATYGARFEAMCRAAASVQPEGLSAFWPLEGRHYKEAPKRVLLVGRATNQWGRHGLDVSGARAESDLSGSQQFVDDGKYARRSRFWETARAVLASLGVARPADETHANGWMQSLAWTNLFKVAPMAGWNPSAAVRGAVRQDCIELLRLEVEALRPDLVLALTGGDWLAEFVTGLDLPLRPTGGRFVDGVARAPGTTWVVARHPMGKPVAPYLGELNSVLQGTMETAGAARRD